jgi:hypothetical protein
MAFVESMGEELIELTVSWDTNIKCKCLALVVPGWKSLSFGQFQGAQLRHAAFIHESNRTNM